MSIFNHISCTPAISGMTRVSYDTLNAQYYGAVQALCLVQAPLDGWVGRAYLKEDGWAFLFLGETAFAQELGKGADLLGWVARHVYLGEACKTCGHFHDPEKLTMVGRQCDPCVYKEAQESLLIGEEILGLPPGDECCPKCGTMDIRSDWKFCRHCGVDLY